MGDFEQIYRSRFRDVYWAAYAVLRDTERAQDMVQTVFLKAFRHKETLLELEEKQLRLWLYRTVRNACLDELRRSRREWSVEEIEPELPDPAPLPEAVAENKAVQRQMLGLIETLPERYRQPILLHYFADMPQMEIAVLLGIKESTLRSRLRRGKALLYRVLKEGGELNG